MSAVATRPLISALGAAALALFFASSALADQPPREWDGLVRVQSQRFDLAYLAPGADFSGYTKIMLDPTEAAFKPNWLRDYNTSTRGLSRRISDADANHALQEVQSGFNETLTHAYAAAGYQVVTEPGPDVLRVRTAVINIAVVAPDVMTPGRSSSFSEESGQATLVVEVRDSVSGAILGRGVDQRTLGDAGFIQRRTSANNRADFERAFRTWAQNSVDALAALRSTPAPAAAAATG